MAIQRIPIDLSGRGGLAEKSYGDLGYYHGTYSTYVNHGINHRYMAEDNQFVGGIFNPLKKRGYLSPSTATMLSVTPASSFGEIITATEVDDINGDVYFFEASTKLHKATGFDDLTLTDDRTLTNGVGTDLSIYSIYGERHLFYSYRYSTTESKIGCKTLAVTSEPTFTADAGTDYITITAGTGYNIVNNRAIKLLSSGTLPAGLSTATQYYMVNVSGSTCQLALTPGGAAVNITDTGSGTHSISLFNDDLISSSGTASGNTTLALSYPKMIPSGDGFAYIINANKVHRFDGTTIGGAQGTLYPTVLEAPSYFTFTNGIDYRNNLYLVIQKNTLFTATTTTSNLQNSDIGIYIWNRQSGFFNTSDFIPLWGVKQVRSIYVAPNGKVRIFCESSDKITQIREYNGITFEVIRTIGVDAFPQYQDSVAVTNGFTVWLGKDGNLYYYGNELKGEKEILFIGGQTPDAVNTFQTGAISFVSDGFTLNNANNQPSFYISYRNNSARVMKKFFPFSGSVNSENHNVLQGDIYTPVKYLPRLCSVRHIDIYLAKFTHSSSLTTSGGTVKIYFNGSTTAWATKTITRGDINKGYFSIEVNKPYINALQLEFEYPTSTAYTLTDGYLAQPCMAIVEIDTNGSIK